MRISQTHARIIKTFNLKSSIAHSTHIYTNASSTNRIVYEKHHFFKSYRNESLSQMPKAKANERKKTNCQPYFPYTSRFHSVYEFYRETFKLKIKIKIRRENEGWKKNIFFLTTTTKKPN